MHDTKAGPPSEVAPTSGSNIEQPTEPASAEKPPEVVTTASSAASNAIPATPPVPNSVTSIHWSKDFVEHLRLVHFALIAAAVALIAVTSSHTAKEYDLARSQLAGIRELQTLTGQLSQGFRDCFLRRIMQNEQAITPTDPAPFAHLDSYRQTDAHLSLPEFNGKSLNVNFSDSSFQIFGDYWVAFGTRDQGNGFKSPFEKIGFFRDAWNGMDSHPSYVSPSWVLAPGIVLIVPYEQADHTIVHTESAKVEQLIASQGVDKKGTSSVQLNLEKCADNIKTLLSSFNQSQCKWTFLGVTNPVSPGKGYYILIPLGERSVDVKLQEPLIAIVKNQRWHTGNFADSFPDLAELTVGLDDLTPEAVDIVLRVFSKRTEAFEFGAIKFPVEQTAFWGIVIILATQLYFWIHLTDFVPRFGAKDEGWQVAWVGVYHTHSAKIAVFSSIIILPCFAIAYAGFRSLGPARVMTLVRPSNGGYGTEAVIIVAMALSLILSIASWLRLAKMREASSEVDQGIAA